MSQTHSGDHIISLTSNSGNTYPIVLPRSSTSIHTLQQAAASVCDIPQSALASLMLHYRDEEGDLVRMDTTAELVERLRELEARSEKLRLFVGQTSEGSAAAVSDADSDDSDSFVRVEASDFLPQADSPRSAHDTSAVLLTTTRALQAWDKVTESNVQFSRIELGADNVDAATVLPSLAAIPAATGVSPHHSPAQPAVESPSLADEAEGRSLSAEVHQPHSPDSLSIPARRLPPLRDARPQDDLSQSVPQLPAVSSPLSAPAQASALNRAVSARAVRLVAAERTWLNNAYRVLLPKLWRLCASWSRGVRRVDTAAASARPAVAVLAVMLVVALIGLKVAVVTRDNQPLQRSMWQLDARIRAIEEYGQRVLAEQRDTTDTVFTLGNQLSQSMAALRQHEERIESMERLLQQRRIVIDALQQQMKRYEAEVQLLRAELATTQQSQPASAQKHSSWLDDGWNVDASERMPRAEGRAEFVPVYDHSLEDFILSSVFDASPQEELQPYVTQTPGKQRKSETRRSTASSSLPSSALWGEPSRFSSSAAWSSPSSADSYSSAGSTRASSIASSSASSSSSSSSLFDSERKSARAERAERRERRKQEAEMSDSLWSFPAPDAESTHKPTAKATTSSRDSASASAAASASSCASAGSRSSSSCPTAADKPSKQHKSSSSSGDSSTCSNSAWKTQSRKGREKGIKQAAKKIGKALQEVNDAAKRVWKSWKSQW